MNNKKELLLYVTNPKDWEETENGFKSHVHYTERIEFIILGFDAIIHFVRNVVIGNIEEEGIEIEYGINYGKYK